MTSYKKIIKNKKFISAVWILLICIPLAIALAWIFTMKSASNFNVTNPRMVINTNESSIDLDYNDNKDSIYLNKAKHSSIASDYYVKIGIDKVVPASYNIQWSLLEAPSSITINTTTGVLDIVTTNIETKTYKILVHCQITKGKFFVELTKWYTFTILGGYIDIVNSGIFKLNQNDNTIIEGYTDAYTSFVNSEFKLLKWLEDHNMANHNQLSFDGYKLPSNENVWVTSNFKHIYLFEWLATLEFGNLTEANYDYGIVGNAIRRVTIFSGIFFGINFKNLVLLDFNELQIKCNYDISNANYDSIKIDICYGLFSYSLFPSLTTLKFSNAKFVSNNIEATNCSIIDIASYMFGYSRFELLEELDFGNSIFSNSNMFTNDPAQDLTLEILTSAFLAATFNNLKTIKFGNAKFASNNMLTTGKIYVLKNTFNNLIAPKLETIDFTNATFAISDMCEQLNSNSCTYIFEHTFDSANMLSLKKIDFANAVFASGFENITFSSVQSTNQYFRNLQNAFSNATLTNLESIDFNNAVFVAKNMGYFRVEILYETFADCLFPKLTSIDLNRCVIAEESNAGNFLQLHRTFSNCEFNKLESFEFTSNKNLNFATKNMCTYVGSGTFYTISETFIDSKFHALKKLDFSKLTFAATEMVNIKDKSSNNVFTLSIIHKTFYNTDLSALEILNISNATYAAEKMLRNDYNKVGFQLYTFWNTFEHADLAKLKEIKMDDENNQTIHAAPDMFSSSSNYTKLPGTITISLFTQTFRNANLAGLEKIYFNKYGNTIWTVDKMTSCAEVYILHDTFALYINTSYPPLNFSMNSLELIQFPAINANESNLTKYIDTNFGVANSTNYFCYGTFTTSTSYRSFPKLKKVDFSNCIFSSNREEIYSASGNQVNTNFSYFNKFLIRDSPATNVGNYVPVEIVDFSNSIICADNLYSKIFQFFLDIASNRLEQLILNNNLTAKNGACLYSLFYNTPIFGRYIPPSTYQNYIEALDFTNLVVLDNSEIFLSVSVSNSYPFDDVGRYGNFVKLKTIIFGKNNFGYWEDGAQVVNTNNNPYYIITHQFADALYPELTTIDLSKCEFRVQGIKVRKEGDAAGLFSNSKFDKIEEIKLGKLVYWDAEPSYYNNFLPTDAPNYLPQYLFYQANFTNTSDTNKLKLSFDDQATIDSWNNNPNAINWLNTRFGADKYELVIA